MTADPSVGLFENEREANFASMAVMVEEVLIELGHVAHDCRIESPEAERAWRVVKGSAEIGIMLVERNDYWHLRVAAAVMTLTDEVDAKAVYRRLLELNDREVYGAAFALRERFVMLVSERSTLDLDRSEVLDLLRRIQNYADDWDDKLVAEFGGVLGVQD